MNLQTSTAPPAGGYAFTLQGDNGYGSTWLGGVLNIDTPGGLSIPGAFSGAGSELDSRAIVPSTVQAVPVLPGTVSIPDQYGRVMIFLKAVLRTSEGGVAAYFAGYPIDATHIQLIETSNYYMGYGNNYPYSDSFGSAMIGQAIGQGAAAGKFSASSLAGSSYVIAGSGQTTEDNGLEPDHGYLIAGVFAAQSNGTISGTFNNDNGKSPASPQPFTGTYTVDPLGRVTITTNSPEESLGSIFYLYLTDNGHAFLLSNDSTGVFQGEAIEQQTTPFTAASFNGTYSLNTGAFPLLADDSDVIGSVAATTSNGTNLLTGFGVTGKMTGTQVGTTDFPISGSFTPASNGIFQGTITGLNLLSPSTP